MIKGIDLFAGAGGTTEGATEAGVDIIWAANHNPLAVEFHEKNHPNTIHSCQDLHQADWSEVPKHDILFASPCCQGHSRAAGRAKRTKKADKSRSTAWAIVSCLEAHETQIAVIENVYDFLKWNLFEPWKMAMERLGYSMSINKVNAADHGVPQNRERIFIIASRSANPLTIKLKKQQHISARSFIDLNFDDHEWDLVENRVTATQNRVRNGRTLFGETFLDAAYGSELGGRSLDKPIGAITTINKHSLVHGRYIRPITISEAAKAQSFPNTYIGV